MKSRILVLIDPSTVDLRAAVDLYAAVARRLEPHRPDEDSIESIKAHHFDYWHLGHPGHLEDDDLSATAEDREDDILKCSAFVRNLPTDYLPSGLITPDGRWHDLQDFGWRLLRDPCEANTRAIERWEVHFRGQVEAFPGHIGVEVITHC